MNPWPLRIAAWVFVLGFCWTVWFLGGKWENPWASPAGVSVPAPAVVNLLPPMPSCGEDCK